MSRKNARIGMARDFNSLDNSDQLLEAAWDCCVKSGGHI